MDVEIANLKILLKKYEKTYNGMQSSVKNAHNQINRYTGEFKSVIKLIGKFIFYKITHDIKKIDDDTASKRVQCEKCYSKISNTLLQVIFDYNILISKYTKF